MSARIVVTCRVLKTVSPQIASPGLQLDIVRTSRATLSTRNIVSRISPRLFHAASVVLALPLHKARSLYRLTPIDLRLPGEILRQGGRGEGG